MSKAALVMSVGDQPVYLFEVAPMLFAFGLIGLHRGLQGTGGQIGRVGGLSAYLSLAPSFANLVFNTTDVRSSERSFNPLILASTLSVFLSLFLLGVAHRKNRTGSLRWPSLPFIVGVSAFPLIMVGGLLETLSERLLEVPILLIGLGWMTIGVSIWSPPREEAL